MKKLLPLIILLSVVAATVNAQEFKKFKVGLGLGYAIPSDGSGGVLLYLEPMYRIQDNITVGLRFESAALVGELPAGATGTVDVSAVASYTLNGQYYFSNGSFRPFVGAGLGIYSLAAATSTIGGTSVSLSASTSSFGFYPRIGFDMGHFNMSIDYNLIPAQETSVNLGSFGGLVTSTKNSSYIGFRLGFAFGGGKK